MCNLKTSTQHYKSAFTLVEIVIVLVIIGILLTIIPLSLQATNNQVQLSLVIQQFEDTRDATSIQMRQGRSADTATISVGTTGMVVVFSGGAQGDRQRTVVFGQKVGIFKNAPLEDGGVRKNAGTPLEDGQKMQREMKSYAIGCGQGGESVDENAFSFTYERMNACFQLEPTSCTLKRMACK